jgi:hypothetical protein
VQVPTLSSEQSQGLFRFCATCGKNAGSGRCSCIGSPTGAECRPRSFDSEVAFTTADHGSRIRSNQSRPSRDDAHCRHGAMSVSQTSFLDHVDKGLGYYVTFFNAILMTPPTARMKISSMWMAAWDCLAPGGTLVAVVVQVGGTQQTRRNYCYFNVGCDGSCASGRTIGEHLRRVRTADAVEAHLCGTRTTYPMSSFPFLPMTNMTSRLRSGPCNPLAGPSSCLH